MHSGSSVFRANATSSVSCTCSVCKLNGHEHIVIVTNISKRTSHNFFFSFSKQISISVR